MLLDVLLFRLRLVPRWISVWALIAVVPYLAGATFVLLDVTTQTQVAALFVPPAINEMSLAVWLLNKSFTPRRTSSTGSATGSAGRLEG